MILRLLLLLLVVSAPATAQTFRSDRMTVSVEGQGPDLILIPGLTSSPRIWDATVKAVPGYRYHRVHVVGFAGAPAGANATGPVSAPVAEEIARYIAEAKLARPAVIGHSMGGTIGLMLAARHPASVGRLMVVDMIPFMGAMFGPPGATADSIRPVADGFRTQTLAAPADVREQINRATIATMVRDEASRAGPIEDMLKSDRTVGPNAMHELIVTDLRPELPRITAPTTVLYVKSPASPLDEAQTDAVFAQQFAGLKAVRLERVPDAWHFIMLDQPTAFAEKVRAFLKP